MLFKRKPKNPTPTPAKDTSPRRRLANLERAHLRVTLQLANPNLGAEHRPKLERKLASISEEIEQLKELVR